MALHPASPRQGAKLCVAVLEEAAELARQAAASDEECSGNLSDPLLAEVATTKYPSALLNYFPPGTIFRTGEETPGPPRPFYRPDD